MGRYQPTLIGINSGHVECLLQHFATLIIFIDNSVYMQRPTIEHSLQETVDMICPKFGAVVFGDVDGLFPDLKVMVMAGA